MEANLCSLPSGSEPDVSGWRVASFARTFNQHALLTQSSEGGRESRREPRCRECAKSRLSRRGDREKFTRLFLTAAAFMIYEWFVPPNPQMISNQSSEKRRVSPARRTEG